MPKRSDDNSHWSPEMGEGLPPNKRAADFVFEKLAGAILSGQMKVGSILSGERELAEKFGISRVIIREAIHRLKDLELVRVKRGGQTVILDPALSSNPRLIPILIEQSPPELAAREFTERQLLQGLALLELAEGRLAKEDLDALDVIIDEHMPGGDPARGAFVRAFWLRVAKGTLNQFIWRESLFWFQMADRIGFNGPVYLSHADRMQLHREVVQKLRDGTGAMEHFRLAIRPVLDLLAAAARHAREAQLKA